MELKIISPQENGFVQEIKWNNEELKAEIAAKMTDYNSLVSKNYSRQSASRSLLRLIRFGMISG